MAIPTLLALFAADNWQASANITPTAGGVHACYYHKISNTFQMGVEMEGSLRIQEFTGTVGYQLELPSADITFRGILLSKIYLSYISYANIPSC